MEAYDIKILEDAGFTHTQAEAILAVNKKSYEHLQEDIVGKINLSESRIESAIKDLELRIVREIHGIRTELKEEVTGLRTELKEEIAGLRTEVKIIKSFGTWLVIAIGVIGGLVGILGQFHLIK